MISAVKIAFVGVVIGAIAVLLIRQRRRQEGCKPVATRSAPCVVSDEDLASRLPLDLKRVLEEQEIRWPQRLTSDWLLNDLLGAACMGDVELYQRFLDQIFMLSGGFYRAAAAIGDMIDPKRMDPGKELPPGYIVQGLIYSGLIRTSDGEVLVKAKVI